MAQVASSAVNVGSINLPKMMRSISHRTSQVRDLTFVRDAVYDKDYKKYPANATSGTELSGPPVNFGYETSSTTSASFTKTQDRGSVTHSYTSTPEIVLSGLTMLQSPIVSRAGRLERTGHRITGACTFYAPSLNYIKALDNFKDTTAFAELESYDKLYDVERIIAKWPDTSTPSSYRLNVAFEDADPIVYTTVPGYEVDRVQFKLKSSGPLELIKFYASHSASVDEVQLNWDFKTSAGGSGAFTVGTTAYKTFDLPLAKEGRAIEVGDTTSIYIDGVAHTAKATAGGNDGLMNINELKGVTDSEITRIQIETTGLTNAIDMKDAFIYKTAEWRIEGIKEYRDEYMQISAARVRGERASRRRTYG